MSITKASEFIGMQQASQAVATVAIETFISTASTYAVELDDGWTMVGNKGGYTMKS